MPGTRCEPAVRDVTIPKRDTTENQVNIVGDRTRALHRDNPTVTPDAKRDTSLARVAFVNGIHWIQ